MGLGDDRSPVTCNRALPGAVLVGVGIVGGVGRGPCFDGESRVGLPRRCGWILGFNEANELEGGDFAKSSKFGVDDVGRC
jgi:hypothetical protein